MPVTPETVTVLGYRVKATDPAWTGLNWSDVVEREKSTLMVFVCGGADNAPDDHHLSVAWMHPNDQAAGYANDPDIWVRYRVRPRRKGYRFERDHSAPTGWLLAKTRP